MHIDDSGNPRRQLYRVLRIPHRHLRCRHKRLFENPEEASLAADDYNEQYIFETLRPYWCTAHQGWHVGHGDDYTYRCLREAYEWFEQWQEAS